LAEFCVTGTSISLQLTLSHAGGGSTGVSSFFFVFFFASSAFVLELTLGIGCCQCCRAIRRAPFLELPNTLRGSSFGDIVDGEHIKRMMDRMA
jgi:hypothetical protein